MRGTVPSLSLSVATPSNVVHRFQIIQTKHNNRRSADCTAAQHNALVASLMISLGAGERRTKDSFPPSPSIPCPGRAHLGDRLNERVPRRSGPWTPWRLAASQQAIGLSFFFCVGVVNDGGCEPDSPHCSGDPRCLMLVLRGWEIRSGRGDWVGSRESVAAGGRGRRGRIWGK